MLAFITDIVALISTAKRRWRSFKHPSTIGLLLFRPAVEIENVRAWNGAGITRPLTLTDVSFSYSVMVRVISRTSFSFPPIRYVLVVPLKMYFSSAVVAFWLPSISISWVLHVDLLGPPWFAQFHRPIFCSRLPLGVAFVTDANHFSKLQIPWHN